MRGSPGANLASPHRQARARGPRPLALAWRCGLAELGVRGTILSLYGRARSVMIALKRLSLPNLIDLCRNLRHYLGAGLTVVDAFRQQAKKGSGRLREVSASI